jgi:hypothetical protein
MPIKTSETFLVHEWVRQHMEATAEHCCSGLISIYFISNHYNSALQLLWAVLLLAAGFSSVCCSLWRPDFKDLDYYFDVLVDTRLSMF